MCSKHIDPNGINKIDDVIKYTSFKEDHEAKGGECFPIRKAKEDYGLAGVSAKVIIGRDVDSDHLSTGEIIASTSVDYIRAYFQSNNSNGQLQYWRIPSNEDESENLDEKAKSWETVSSADLERNEFHENVSIHQNCWEVLQAISKKEKGLVITPRVLFTYANQRGMMANYENYEDVANRFPCLFKYRFPTFLEGTDVGRAVRAWFLEKKSLHIPINNFPLTAAYDQVASNPYEKVKTAIWDVESLKECQLYKLPQENLEWILSFTDVRSAINLASTCRTFRSKVLPNLNRIAEYEIRRDYSWMLPITNGEEADWQKVVDFFELQTGGKGIPWLVYMRLCSFQDFWGMVNRRGVIEDATRLYENIKGDKDPYWGRGFPLPDTL